MGIYWWWTGSIGGGLWGVGVRFDIKPNLTIDFFKNITNNLLRLLNPEGILHTKPGDSSPLQKPTPPQTL